MYAIRSYYELACKVVGIDFAKLLKIAEVRRNTTGEKATVV